ncbi:hypothetical protein NMR87_004536 [Vibrio alginolyticus]|uniref:hypothetical protein n=1 Tax=Vibrio alginolyticus TaxID=663 RepID=UPI003D7D7AA9|nr:hypothetical protein [Vibrio alginolyticus]
MKLEVVGIIFFFAGLINIGILRKMSKLAWRHPLMFCYYSLTLMGLSLSISPMVQKFSLAASLLLALITVLMLPSKAILKAIDDKSDELKKQSKAVTFYDILRNKAVTFYGIVKNKAVKLRGI